MPLIHTQAVLPSASNGGAQRAKIATTASTNATSVKASPGHLVGYALTNTTAAFKYFRLYNKASAPTVGTDSPLLIVGVAPNSTLNLCLPQGLEMSLGVAYAITGAVADLDATVTAANDVIGALFYA